MKTVKVAVVVLSCGGVVQAQLFAVECLSFNIFISVATTLAYLLLRCLLVNKN